MYPLEFTGVVPPCQEFVLAAVYVAIPNLSTPPNSLVGEPSCFTPEGVVSCFNGLWRTDLSSDDLYGIKRQFLGVRSRSIDPFSPYDPFYSPPAQTTDFLRLELDIDGVATLAAPPGVLISRDFTSTLPVLKYFKVNVELFDINLFANFAFNKSEVFTPRLNVTYHFSENVIIDGLSVREYEMPVRTEAYAAESLCEPDDVDGEALCHDGLAESEPELFNQVEFQHTGGDLQITKTFSIDGHTLNEKLILHFQPLLEGKLFNLSVKLNDDKLKKILPSFSASALQYTIDPFDVYQPILDNTSKLGGFDDVEGEVALRLRVPELDLDGDDDGVRDGLDNCIDELNPDQNDLDQDSLGDLLAKVEVLKASRQALKIVDQTAKSKHKLAVQALRLDIDTERQAEKVRHAVIKQTINDLRDLRRATGDDELKITLGDQIAEQYAARQQSALLSLQRTQRLRREIVELRDERQFTRDNHLSALLEINGDISALRLEIRLRRAGPSAELDLIGHEIFEMQSQRRDLRAQQALLKSESSAVINSLQEQIRVDKLALKVAQKSKSDDIRTVRALQRREKDKSARVMLKAEVDLLKLDARALRTAAKSDISAIKSEISLIRDNVKSARDTTRDAGRVLRDQIKALRKVKLVQVN